MKTQALSTPSSPAVRLSAIKAEPISMNWDPSLSVFAKESFLRAVGDECGWLGGKDEDGTLRCVLPYTIVRKTGLRMVRFRVQTIPWNIELDVAEEKSFLNSVVEYFRNAGADVIIPPTNNTLFRTYPDGASAAPYGSHVVDLRRPEDAVWKGISKTSRQNITAAQKDGVSAREGMEFLDHTYVLIHETFQRSQMGFMSRDSFRKFALSLGENCKILVAEHQGTIQSASLFAFSVPSAFWIYGGNIQAQHPGAMKLLQWEAMRLFRTLGVHQYDFFGARIDPPKGSKQEGINKMKKMLGGNLAQGYVWKYSLRPRRAWVYSKAIRVLRGGDIVDQEQHKLNTATVGAVEA